MGLQHFLRNTAVFCVVLGAVFAAPGEKKTSGDFEFVEDRTSAQPSTGGSGTRTWLLDPANALCGLLRCGSREVCLLQDRFTAVCVDKAEVARSGDKVVPLDASTAGGSSSSTLLSDDSTGRRLPSSDTGKDASDSRRYLDVGSSSSYDDDDDDFEDDEDDDEEYYDDEEDGDDDKYDGDDDEEYDDDEDNVNEDRRKYVFKATNVEDEDDQQQKKDDSNATEGSSATSSSSTSPQLDRQPFASKQCGGCPLTRPVFLCGSDNRTYSSMCRLHFHNCIHQAKVEVACKGFCPCKEPGRRSSRRNKTSLMSKLRATQQQTTDTAVSSSSDTVSNSRHVTGSAADSVTRRPGNNGGGNKKYKKYNKNGMRKKGRKTSNKRRNEVLRTPTNNVWGPNECSQDALAAMGNRMLDWFSVIMSDTQHKTQPSARAPSWCKHEVAWMLGHLDSDSSGQLEGRELYQLEHDDREKCIKPFFDRCDLDRDGHMSGREWCKCFDKSERPCAALRTASQALLGGYIPECDSEGWYRPVQCQGSGSLCWCVDRHGVELPYSRTHGQPRCDTVEQSRDVSSNSRDDDDGEDDEETIVEGSADMPLDI